MAEDIAKLLQVESAKLTSWINRTSRYAGSGQCASFPNRYGYDFRWRGRTYFLPFRNWAIVSIT